MKSAKLMALMFSLLLILAAQMDLSAQTPAPTYVELNAVQLDQLVAPIALDPDSLVAQILTASTYPDQVTAADTWLNQSMNLPPDQRAAGANDKSWDPAVKGLTAFPAVLDTLGKNTAWTSQLGNAYYNQPGDVMNAIQAMRLQAQQLNVLVTTAQQRVIVEVGLIEIVPVNPAVIYVPYYNPWRVWGTLFVSYPGFVVLPPPSGIVWGFGLAFDPGIEVGVYAGFDWGFSAWAPAWGDGVVAFNHNTYVSNSRTVANHGYFGGHDRDVFEHGGRGVPGGFHACAHAGAARAACARASAARKPSAGHPQTTSRSASSRSPSVAHKLSGSRSASASRKPSTGRPASSRSVSVGHSSPASRSTSAHRMPYVEHPFSTGARHPASASRSPSAGRSASACRTASASRTATANRTPSASCSAPANRSASTGRSTPAGRSASANRTATANRPASANRSPSAGRSASPGRFPSAGLSASAGGSGSAGRSSRGHAGRGR